MELIKLRRNIINAPHIKKAEGNTLSFNTNMTGLLKACNVKIKPVQDLHGQEYPYPPGGSTNLFDKDNATVYARAMNTVSGKWISYNAKSYAFPCKQNTDYVVTAVRSGLPLFRIAYITESSIPESGDVNVYNIQQRSSEGSLYIHTGADATYLIMQPTGSYADSTKIQVEEGSTPTQYHPFSNVCPINGWTGVELNHTGTLFEISFPDANTIYGGTLDLLTGVLTVNRFAYTEDGSTANQWSINSTTNEVNRLILSKSYLPHAPKNNSTDNLLVNYFKSSVTTAIWNAFIGSTGNFLCYVPSSLIPDINSWETYVTANPLIFVYELDEPIFLQLTPQQISAFKGANNIFANTGETYVEYWIH